MLELQQIKDAATSKIGFFRFKKFNESTYLITNDAWKFEFLNVKDFEQFLSGKKLQKLSKYESLLKKGFIKSVDYNERMLGSVVQKNHFVWSGPTLHMIVVTLRCNHKCQYCHAAVAPMSAKNFDMTKETAKKVVDTIFFTNAPGLTIEFQWWEALVNYEVVQFIVEYSKERAMHLKKELSLVMVSNLTLMTEEKMSWLLDNWVDVCTSLDGDQVTHNNNRTGYQEGNSFETVTYWMKRLQEEKTKRNMWRVWALLTATKETLPKYKDIIDTYVSLWLEWIFLRWLNPYGFASAQMEKLAYESWEWIDFYKSSLDYIIELNKSGVDFKENITSIYLMKIFNAIDPAFMDIRSPSGIAIGGVAYNYDGKIYASDESRMLGRMGDDSFLMANGDKTWKDNYQEMINSDITKIAVQSSTLDGLPWYNDHVYKPYLWVDIIHNYKIWGSLYLPMQKDEKMKLQISILDYIFEKLQNPEDEKILMSWIGK